MDPGRFEELVGEVLDDIGPQVGSRMKNVEVVIAGAPTREQLQAAGVPEGKLLLGLYQGIPRTHRGLGYTMVLPDKITLFRSPIQKVSRSETQIKSVVRGVLLHEIGHHLGLSEQELRGVVWKETHHDQDL